MYLRKIPVERLTSLETKFPLPFGLGNFSSLDWYFSQITLPNMIYLYIMWRSVLLVEEIRVPGEKTCRKSLTNFITYCCIEYTSPELTTLVVMGTNFLVSNKSNYIQSRSWLSLRNKSRRDGIINKYILYNYHEKFDQFLTNHILFQTHPHVQVVLTVTAAPSR